MSVRVGDEIVAGGQGDMYTKAQVDALIANAIAQTTEKPGMIKPFAGTTVPTGYLLCDGSAVSRTTYANLFSAIGTTYGSGDGSTTFNLPDLNDRLPRMASNHTRGGKNAGWAPNITGVGQASWWFEPACATMTGAFAKDSTTDGRTPNQTGTATGARGFTFDASRVWAGYANGVTSIMAQNLTVLFIIKY